MARYTVVYVTLETSVDDLATLVAVEDALRANAALNVVKVSLTSGKPTANKLLVEVIGKRNDWYVRVTHDGEERTVNERRGIRSRRVADMVVEGLRKRYKKGPQGESIDDMINLAQTAIAGAEALLGSDNGDDDVDDEASA